MRAIAGKTGPPVRDNGHKVCNCRNAPKAVVALRFPNQQKLRSQRTNYRHYWRGFQTHFRGLVCKPVFGFWVAPKCVTVVNFGFWDGSKCVTVENCVVWGGPKCVIVVNVGAWVAQSV